MECIRNFARFWSYLRSLPVKLTITSNGHSAAVLSDDELRAFHDIEFSLDYPTEREQDAQRGSGNWALIHDQAARCVRLGVPVTFIAVMMKSNYLRLAEVARVAKRYEAPLRVNVYQSVRSDLYALSYEEYWQGFRALFAETDVIAIGEPLVRAMAGLPPRTRRVRGEYRADHSASDHPALRILAGSWGTSFASGLSSLCSCGDFALCRGAHRAGSVPPVRLSRKLLRRMCRAATHPERSQSAGLLLPCCTGTGGKTGSPHGCRSRTSQGRKRVHDNSDCTRLEYGGDCYNGPLQQGRLR